MHTPTFPYNVGNIANLLIYKFTRLSYRFTALIFTNMLIIKGLRDYRLGDIYLILFA